MHHTTFQSYAVIAIGQNTGKSERREMGEKLRDVLKPIICRECGLIGKVACVDDCSKLELVANIIEQAFRDAGWKPDTEWSAELEELKAEVAKLRDRIDALRLALEPQQPGELAKSNCYSHNCITPYPAVIMSKCCACVWDEATLAQLAHDKQRMVKLPSEDELALWLCDHLSYTSRELAQVLLERLLGEGHE